MMSHRILPAALLLCTLAACGQSPTGSDTHTQPGGPSYDSETQDTGGFGMGGGRASDTENTSVTSTTTAGDAMDSGGFGMGGGK